MNLRARCVNKNCSAFSIEKSVIVGQMLGFGAANDRVKCPACGQLMRTTRSINVSEKRTSKRTPSRRYIRHIQSRTLGTRPSTRKRTSKRGASKRSYKR
jgi:hypothetical protein